MKKLVLGGGMVVLALLSAACQEELSTPADCPDLCPGTSLEVRDTVLQANTAQDSSYTGYIGALQAPSLLVSNSDFAGQARTFVTFSKLPDSVTIDGTPHVVTVDSVVIGVVLQARDSTVQGLTLFFHRISPDLDSTTTLPQVDAMLTPGTLIDSVVVPDTLRRGPIRLVIPGDQLDRLATPPADSGRLGVGLRLRALDSTGIRLGSQFSAEGGPTITAFGKIDVTDTTLRKQSLAGVAERSNYVIQVPAVPGGDKIVVGGKLGTRTILRFTLPRALRDSATILRATLELTPAGPLRGLRNDPASLQLRGLLADLGAKSLALAGASAVGSLPAGATAVQFVDVRSIVETWTGVGNTRPTTLMMGVAPEGGTFSTLVFFSTLAASGAPRLRITYALPSRPGHP